MNFRVLYLVVLWSQLTLLKMRRVTSQSIFGSQCWPVSLIWPLILDQRLETVHLRFCSICWTNEVANFHPHFGRTFFTAFYFRFLIMSDMLEKRTWALLMNGHVKVAFIHSNCCATCSTLFTRYGKWLIRNVLISFYFWKLDFPYLIHTICFKFK